MTEKEKNKTKAITFRAREVLLSCLKKEAKARQMSLNSYINFLLNSAVARKEILFDEVGYR